MTFAKSLIWITWNIFILVNKLLGICFCFSNVKGHSNNSNLSWRKWLRSDSLSWAHPANWRILHYLKKILKNCRKYLQFLGYKVTSENNKEQFRFWGVWSLFNLGGTLRKRIKNYEDKISFEAGGSNAEWLWLAQASVEGTGNAVKRDFDDGCTLQTYWNSLNYTLKVGESYGTYIYLQKDVFKKLA